MNHLLRHTTVFLALLTLLLTACGRSAPTHFYLLDSGQPPARRQPARCQSEHRTGERA